MTILKKIAFLIAQSPMGDTLGYRLEFGKGSISIDFTSFHHSKKEFCAERGGPVQQMRVWVPGRFCARAILLGKVRILGKKRFSRDGPERNRQLGKKKRRH